MKCDFCGQNRTSWSAVHVLTPFGAWCPRTRSLAAPTERRWVRAHHTVTATSITRAK